MRNDKNKKRDSESGAAVVEFAVLTALFLLIVLGLLEFGVMFFEKHYIAGAAREGVRVGVIANNYDCFVSGAGCVNPRRAAVDARVTEYLGAVFSPDNILFTEANIVRDPGVGASSDSVELSVTVEVNNIMPAMITGMVPGYTPPTTFSHTATGTYEDPSEE